MGRRCAPIASRRPAPAPAPRIAGPGEADFLHQAGKRVPAESHGRRELGIDRVGAAGRSNLARVACKPVGEVDPDPLAAKAAERQRR